jgi:uncharacterized protein YdeI (YjbR/CyaY-like superfamily)
VGKKDARVDAYIDECPDFARPILKELRKRVHASVPEVVETIRWRAPYFQYKDTLLGGMASFKQHCAFGFWHPLLRDGDTSLEGMGRFGHVKTIGDLPPEKEFAKLAKQAKRLVDDGVKGPPRPPPAPDRKVVIPPDLAALFRKNAKARATYDAFSYSKRKEYVDWINDAKREETRKQRLATTVEWLAEGKSRMWKYEKA